MSLKGFVSDLINGIISLFLSPCKHMLFNNIIQLIVHALPSIWGGVIKISLKIELFIYSFLLRRSDRGSFVVSTAILKTN